MVAQIMNKKTSNSLLLLCTILLLYLPSNTTAEGLRLGMIGKSITDGNFIDSWQGCQEYAQLSDNECVLLGNEGAANARQQLTAINLALDKVSFDALALSVTNSNYLAQGLANINIPLITFDSPFAAKDNKLSRAYVGIDNVEFGRQLGELVKKLKPNGGRVCIFSTLHDTNIAQRVWGVRQALSGYSQLPVDSRLQGQTAWIESDRCPLNTADNIPRALNQLQATLQADEADIYIAVGWWPIVDSQAYRQTIADYQHKFRSHEVVLVAGVGKTEPEYDELLEQHLLHGYVSINFPEIGRLSAKIMTELSQGKALTDNTLFVANIVRTVEGLADK
ncbi:hypothetical protein A9Q78_05080 [Methylophaga sp. 41_12_T18]|nr:hypothetical protein A9Q78_05080 [Methylophaga sp. 41_12_T18]